MEKRYLALLAGRWRRGAARVDAPLRKNVLQGGERVVRVAAAGKAAVTASGCCGDIADSTLVEAGLVTGRTHQIRVHAAHLGTPILGDAKYGDAEANRRYRAARATPHVPSRRRAGHPLAGRGATVAG